MVSLSWSPDGKTIAYLISKTPTQGWNSYDELYLLDANCLKDIPSCKNQTRLFVWSHQYFWDYPIVWSPDSKNILIEDGDSELRCINLANGTSVDVSKFEKEIPDLVVGYAWSPDNQYIAFMGFRGSSGPLVRKFSIVQSPYGKTPVDPNNNIDIDVLGDSVGLVDWIKVLTFEIGRSYKVNPLGADLAVRAEPSLDGKIIRKLESDEKVLIVDGPVQADYYTLWKVRIDNVEGWIQGIKYWLDASS